MPEYSVVIMHAVYDLWYGLAFAMGLFVLLMFSLEKFDQPYTHNRHLAALLPSKISDGSAYTRAFLMYFLILSLMYAAACVVLTTMPNLLGTVLGEARKAPPVPGQPMLAPLAAPLAVALAMVGLLPKLPQFGEVEARLRRFSHRAIGVPDGLTDMESCVADLALDTEHYSSADRQSRAHILRLFLARQIRLAPPGVRAMLEAWLAAGDAEAPLPSADGLGLSAKDAEFLYRLNEQVRKARNVTGKWYRAKFLMARMNGPAQPGHPPGGNAGERFHPLNEELDTDFEAVSDAIVRIRKDVENLVELLDTLAGSRAAGSTLAPVDLSGVETYLDRLLEHRLEDLTQIESAVDGVLSKIYFLVAAAVVLQPTEAKRAAKLATFGLLRAPVQRANTDDALLATAGLATGLLAFSYLYHWVSGAEDPLSIAVRTVVSTVIIHGIGVSVAFARRRRLMERGTWFLMLDGDVVVPVRQYMTLAAWAFLPAYAAVCLWTWVLFAAPATPQPMDRGILATLAVAALGACVTALFTVWHLDLARKRAVPLPKLAAWSALQGAATAFVVVLASETQSPGVATDLVATGFVAGALMGAMVLMVASKRSSPAYAAPPGRDAPGALAAGG